MKSRMRMMMQAMVATVLAAAAVGAQAVDPATRLRETLPPAVAEQVLATIAQARDGQLPPAAVTALENRALKFASRGVPPEQVARAIADHARRMQAARGAIEAGRGVAAAGDEIDAGAEAMRQGVDGAAVSALAKSVPSGRSLAVPLYVVGSLVERGLPADQALTRVRERLLARASDGDLERMAREQQRGRPDGVGPGMRPTDRPGATGRPDNVPATGRRQTPPAPVSPPAGPRRP